MFPKENVPLIVTLSDGSKVETKFIINKQNGTHRYEGIYGYVISWEYKVA